MFARYGVSLLGVGNYACVRFLVSDRKSNKSVCENRQSYSHRPRTFCRTVRRVTYAGEVKFLRNGAEGIPSLKRAKKSAYVDPKPGDLSMSRLKEP